MTSYLKRLARKIFTNTVRFLSRGWGLGQMKWVARIYSFFYSLVKDKKGATANVNGFLMHLDENDALGLSVWGTYEEEQTKLVMQKVKPGDWVIDVGANIGYYTLLMSRLSGSGGKIFAFEPDPENFSLLKKNIGENKCTNVIAEHAAVSDRNGALTLYRDAKNTADNRVFRSEAHKAFGSVQAVSLNEYFKGREEKINFIKMDIQGFEVFALKGMMNILASAKRLEVMTEFWPKAIAESGADPREFLRIFRKFNFDIFEIGGTEKRLIPITDDEAFLLSRAPEKDKDANLFCVKKGHHGK